MPLPVLCESANTSRCALGDAARSLLRTSGKKVFGSGVELLAHATSASKPAMTSPLAAPSAPPRNARRERAPGGRGAGGIPLSCLAVSATGHRVQFSCDGEQFELDTAPGESLLSVLRERIGEVSPKDGCAPQGQCGCCTVLVDGEPRVACVTPVTRVEGRSVVTVEGLDAAVRDDLAARFVATGGSQCGFCTPGILVRLAAAGAKGKTRRVDLDRALAAHLCRCTGWQSIYGAVEAAGLQWVVAESLLEARALAGKVQGRRTTVDPAPPLAVPDPVDGGVRLATSWVEPAYLEPDASWCAPGAEPATPLANGGAFGGKATSQVGEAARELADRTGRTVRVVYAREDVVRLGPKRPPIAATASFDGTTVHVRGTVVGDPTAFITPIAWPYAVEERGDWTSTTAPGPSTASTLRAVGLAERAVLLE